MPNLDFQSTDLDALPADAGSQFLADPTAPAIQTLQAIDKGVEAYDHTRVGIEPERGGQAMKVKGDGSGPRMQGQRREIIGLGLDESLRNEVCRYQNDQPRDRDRLKELHGPSQPSLPHSSSTTTFWPCSQPPELPRASSQRLSPLVSGSFSY